MRPNDAVLRYAFRSAAVKLKLSKRTVTVNSLAEEMRARFKTVQRFLYRDRELAEEIGVEPERIMHGLGEYAEVIVSIPSGVRPTARRIAAVLKLDHSSVVRFVKAHPELYALHPRFEPWSNRHVAVQEQTPPAPIIRQRWRDLGIAVWHESAGRFVGVCATRDEYLNYWNKGLLKHQQEGRSKPEHLPTPEQVRHMT